ncbi:type IV pilin protein [Oxalobacteraceae bacterium R-40]|uniref:Type IV pilin protein n=1 Tax=Keguizhuia sedimenti TaxID=3064264 RepID=A0ABU1BL98_9BURK|nr:type IV pilin protein [Oxalobacteraceae bacterium R-40]
MKPSENKIHFLNRHACPGFSLLELMVVLVILAILAAFQYPSYKESVRKARRAEGRAALAEAMQQQERLYSQQSSYVAFSASNPNGFKWFSGDSPKGSAYELRAEACKNDTVRNCIVVYAMPGTARVKSSFQDDLCGELSLSSNGINNASGTGNDCW